MSFGKDFIGFIGGLNNIFLHNVGMEPSSIYAPQIPSLVFMSFQMMFAIITPALISGAIVERMRLGALYLYLVYNFVVYTGL